MQGPPTHLADGGVHSVLHAEHLDRRALLLQPLKQRALHLDLRHTVRMHEGGRQGGRGEEGRGQRRTASTSCQQKSKGLFFS